MGRRGATLAFTLIFGLLLLTLGLTLAAGGVTHLHFGLADQSQAFARNAADSPLSISMERLLTDQEFPSGSGVVEVEFGQALGRLTFDASVADSLSLPLSYDNRGGEVDIIGWKNRVVPKGTVQLVALGECGGRRCLVESMVRYPRFPYAIASAGPVITNGHLLIGAIEKIDDLLPRPKFDELHDADLFSNSGGRSISLNGSNVVVAGNLEAVGNIDVETGVQVKGELKPLSTPMEIPELDIEQFFEKSSSALLPGEISSGTVSGSRRWADANLRAANGMDLKDGVILADGDVEIWGGLRGRGAIVARGSITVHGGASLAAEDQVALLADGDVTIEGNGPEGSFFQGSIYTGGDLKAENVTLVGLFVAGSPATEIDPGSRTFLKDSNIVNWEGAAELTVESTLYSFKYGRQRDADSWEVQVELTPGQAEELRTLMELAVNSDDRQKTQYYNEIAQMLQHVPVYTNGSLLTRFNRGDEDLGALIGIASTAETPLSGEDGLSLGASTTHVSFDFDLNEYLKLSDQLKVVYYREH